MMSYSRGNRDCAVPHTSVRKARNTAQGTWDQPILADRSGVLLPTFHRILTGNGSAASIDNIFAVAQVLGMDVEAVPRIDAKGILEQQARKKAKQLVSMVQGKSALESQAVSSRHIGQMIEKTAKELLAGSRRRLSAE